jgi:hypothetical protein
MVWAKWVVEDGRFGFSLGDNGGHQITEAFRDALLADEAAGRLIIPDSRGFPTTVAPPGPTPEQLAEDEREWRDQELSKMMGIRDRHRDQLELGGTTTLSDEQFKGLLAYMQRLRDWPQSAAFPATDQRPEMPDWLTQLNW